MYIFFILYDRIYGAAPPGYIPGIGRGAKPIESGVRPIAPGVRPKASDLATLEAEDNEGQSSNYDPFLGYKETLFGKNTPYDEEDKEADDLYSMIDERMEQRHRKARERREKREKAASGDTTKLSQLYEAEKLGLKAVTADQWLNLPEARRITKRKRESKRDEKYTPVPDSVIVSALSSGEIDSSIDPSAGTTTSVFSSGTATGQLDVATMYEARNQATALKLQHV